MSVVRQGQYPFEQEWNDGNRGLEIEQGTQDTWATSAVNPYTGSESIRISGSHRSGFGFTCPVTDDVRAAFFMSHAWTRTDGDWIQFFKSGQGDAGLAIKWMKDEYRFDLYTDGVKRQEFGMFDTPIWEFLQEGQWCSHGFHLLGGSRFVYTIDGVAMIDYTNANVPDSIEAFWVGKLSSTGWGASLSIDDLYMDLVVGESYSVPPSYRFMMSVVDADGITQDWAGFPAGGNDYTKVDDAEPDDDDTCVWTPSTNSPEDFNTADITLPDDHSIVAAIPWAIARKGDASRASQIRLRAYDGSYTDGADQDLPTWYYELWERMTTDPSSNPWTESNFNSAEFGVQSRGTV